MAFIPFTGDAAEFFYPLLRLEGTDHYPGCVQGQGQKAPIGKQCRSVGKNAVIGVSGCYILDHGNLRDIIDKNVIVVLWLRSPKIGMILGKYQKMWYIIASQANYNN
jgi:hypothetical protein